MRWQEGKCMLVSGAECLKGQERLKNCRVQSLCDLLTLNRVDINSHFIHLLCFDTLLGFTEIIQNNISLPFVSCFYEDLEERFLKEHNIKYTLDYDLISTVAMKDKLKADKAFMVLCDANSVFKSKMNSQKLQVSVCSGITIIGYNLLGEFIFSQHSKNKDFSSISSKLLSYARNFDVLPSSPANASIIIESVDKSCQYDLNSYDFMICKVKKSLKNFVEQNDNAPMKITNKGIVAYYGYQAKEKFMEYLLSLVEWLNNQNIDPNILEKVYALKIKMLRKSMISGTSSLNRTEFAESLSTLNMLNPTLELERLAEGFKLSGNKFRNIVRLLGTVDNNLHQKEKYMFDVINAFNNAFQYEEQLIEEFLK